MTQYQIAGLIEAQEYDPTRPVFVHEPSTDPSLVGIKRVPGRRRESIIRVSTDNATVALQLEHVFNNVFDNVVVHEDDDDE